MPIDPLVQRRIAQRLRDTGLHLLDIEAVWMVPDTDVNALMPVLDIGTALGARHLVVSGDDPERGRLASNLSRLCEACQPRGLRVMLEFLPYTALRSLADAASLLAEIAPADAGLLVDALHLSRSGGRPSDLDSYDPALFSFVHLCDAPAAPPLPADLRAEARGGRLYPGEGELWLADLIRACPTHAIFAVEAPYRRYAGLPAVERAKKALSAIRAVLVQAAA